jgi:hypothetical protein
VVILSKRGGARNRRIESTGRNDEPHSDDLNSYQRPHSEYKYNLENIENILRGCILFVHRLRSRGGKNWFPVGGVNASVIPK